MGMAYDVTGPASLQLPFEAGEDLSAKQYCFVKLNSSGKIVACTVDGEIALGVLQDAPVSGQAGTVMIYGVSKVRVATSEALVAGNNIGTTTAGTATRVDATSTGADLGDCIMGMILQSVTGSSPAAVLGTLLIRPLGRVTA